MIHLINDLDTILEQGQPVISATVLSHHGSTPRSAGSKMLVLSSGDIFGTIGGGQVEAQVIEAALQLFESQGSQIRSFDLSAQDGFNDLDVICGGHMTVIISHIDANNRNRDIFKTLKHQLEGGHTCYLISSLGGPLEDIRLGQPCLVVKNGQISGDCPYPDDDINQLLRQTRGVRTPQTISSVNGNYLLEPYLNLGSVYIFGGGHVGKQVATLSKLVDFRAIVLDDREEFANTDLHPAVDQVELLDSFESAFPEQQVDTNSYIVIVTRGHRHDQTVLAQSLQTDAGYIGMIGSRKKRDTIYANLLDQGFTQSDLQRVHSPIGLDIEAETPQEIAVSIVAEMIKARAKK